MYLFQVSYLVMYFLEVLETPLRLGHRIRADYDSGGHQRVSRSAGPEDARMARQPWIVLIVPMR